MYIIVLQIFAHRPWFGSEMAISRRAWQPYPCQPTHFFSWRWISERLVKKNSQSTKIHSDILPNVFSIYYLRNFSRVKICERPCWIGFGELIFSAYIYAIYSAPMTYVYQDMLEVHNMIWDWALMTTWECVYLYSVQFVKGWRTFKK